MTRETKELFDALFKELNKTEEQIDAMLDSVQASIDAFREENRNQHEQMMREINACKLNPDTVNLLLTKVNLLENEVNIPGRV